MTSSSGQPKVCFNNTCKQAMEVANQGWLCRTGDFAELCNRCVVAFNDGRFCDTYHLNASGWRRCESCGKQIHCGCIVSFHMFILLDAGGIECLNCAKTEYILTPNPTWPSASHVLPGPAEKIRDVSSNNWRHIAGSGPVPWRQAPSLFSSFKSQHELQLTSYSSGQSATYDSYQPFSFQEMLVAHDQKSDKGNVSRMHVQRLCPPVSVGREFSNSNGAGPSLENQARGVTHARNQLVPRYWPRFTDQGLQQISGGSNTKITPLFEKVLSCSDAGKIGRLVLPKKFAEAYLPPIFTPEGYPLVIQDSNGKDWVLQYRFWSNSNSRMYVLEGVTPCIQSMQLQAGDTVTFSRLEPEGKLIMGFRKAPLVSPSHRGNETTNTRVSTHEETSNDGKLRYPDGTWSEVDKISISAKRIGGKRRSHDISVTLEQAQGLLRSHLTNPPTIVLIDGVKFEFFQEAPIIESPVESSTDNARSLCSTEIEPTPEHLDHMLPMINRAVKHATPPLPMMHTRSEKQVGNSMQRPTHLFADIIRCTQMGNTQNSTANEARKIGAWPSLENDPNRGYRAISSFRSQSFDLNMQPEREEEPSRVSDSMGIMRLVQESTQRYMKLQRLSINGISDGNHKNRDQ